MQIIRSSGRYATMKDAERSDYLAKPMVVGGKVVLVEGLNPHDDCLVAEEKEKVAVYRQAMEMQMGKRPFSGRLGEDVKRKRVLFKEAEIQNEGERLEVWTSSAGYLKRYEKEQENFSCEQEERDGMV